MIVKTRLLLVPALAVLMVDVFVQVPRSITLLTALLLVVVGWGLGHDTHSRLIELQHQVRTDPLTGLANRTALYEDLAVRLTASREGDEPFAVLLLDLDRFKEINDSLGHHVGDQLLIEVGHRLQPMLRDQDLFVRLGGDEFAMVVPGDEPLPAARRLLSALTEPFLLDGMRVRVGGSVGVARYPDDARDANGLLQRADVAMYVAKAAGGGVSPYDPQHDQHSRERLRTVEQLRAALLADELTVYYQPQCDVATGLAVGAEALVRWRHPTRGVLAPEWFLPLVEQAGLMSELTRTVMEQAVAQCVSWRSRGLDVGVSVNLSASNLLDEDLTDHVVALLGSSGLPAEALTLELTENLLLSDPERCLVTLERLKAVGVWLSIDDYGTGYCSLSYLQSLPVDELKLDRAFLTDLEHSRNTSIVRSTVDLAHDLGLRVVAEGVEDAAGLDLLRQLGCDTAQGFFLSRPLTADAMTAWLLAPAPGPPPPPPPPGSPALVPALFCAAGAA